MTTETTIKYAASAQALTVSGLNSLAGGSSATSGEVDNTTTLFMDVMVEILIADIAESGNTQVIVYAIDCMDGTNYSDNQSGNLQALATVGVLPTNGSGPWRSKAFSLANAFGGFVPPKWKLVIFNDNGAVALAGSGNSAQYRGVTFLSS